ncbi:MAG TPA: hypothetical protein VKO18_17830 [Terriglobia bacterium]|nr:hypothetical protein [Terriglobia bacterium]
MTLAELVIKLSADTASLKSDFDKAHRFAASFASEVESVMAGMGTAIQGIGFAGAFAEMEHLADVAGKFGQEIYKAGITTGLTAEELSGLHLVAKEAGGSFESLTSAVSKAGKNITSGLENPANKAGKVLSELFTAQELAGLKLEPTSKRIQDVTTRIFSLSEAGERSLAASTIFGKGWGENAEELQALAREGIDPLIARSKALGDYMSMDGARAAHEFETSLKELKAAGEGLELTFGSKLVKPFSELFGLLAGNKMMLAEFKDELKLLGIGLEEQLLRVADPLGLLTHGLRDSLAKQATDIFTDQMGLLAKFHADMAAIGEPGSAGGGTKLNLSGGSTSNAAPSTNNPFQIFGSGQQLGTYAVGIDGMTKAIDVDVESINLWANSLKPIPLVFSEINRQLVTAIPTLSKIDLDALSMGQNFSNAFTKMMLTGKGFNSVMESMIEYIGEAIIKATLFQGIWDALGGMGGPLGAIGSFFHGLAGGKASGGAVQPYTPYVVGERGPELFMPGAGGGSIIPNSSLGGGRGNVFNIDARGADAGVEQRVMRAAAMMSQQAAIVGYRMSVEMAKRT